MKETFSKILPFVPIISLIGILLAFVINTISKEPFKLRHDSITLEYGAPLSESYSMEPYVYASWEPLSIGDHSVSLTLSDKFGNTASYNALIHVVYDLSPENRAELSAHYTEAEIRAAIEQAKPMD